MHPHQSINNNSLNVYISCIALLYATITACIYFFKFDCISWKMYFDEKQSANKCPLAVQLQKYHKYSWPRYALTHVRPAWQHKQNNGICYMAEQEFALFTIPFIGMKGIYRPTTQAIQRGYFRVSKISHFFVINAQTVKT